MLHGPGPGQYYQDPMTQVLSNIEKQNVKKMKFHALKHKSGFHQVCSDFSRNRDGTIQKNITFNDKICDNSSSRNSKVLNSEITSGDELQKKYNNKSCSTQAGYDESIIQQSTILNNNKTNESNCLGYFGSKTERFTPIVQNDNVGPGSYDIFKRRHTEGYIGSTGPGFKSTSPRFDLQGKDQIMANLGPGFYDCGTKKGIEIYKFKPSAAFCDKTPKDLIAAELGKKMLGFGQKSFSLAKIQNSKGKLGRVHEVLDFDDDNVDIRKIKPCFINGLNPGPGQYETNNAMSTKFSSKNFKTNSTFLASSPRFNNKISSDIVGPGAYENHEQISQISQKNMNLFMKKKLGSIPFDSLEKRFIEDKKVNIETSPLKNDVPGPGRYEEKPGIAKLAQQKKYQNRICTQSKEIVGRELNYPTKFISNIGPGAYEQLHMNLKKPKKKLTVCFKSNVERMEKLPVRDEEKDGKFEKYNAKKQNIEEISNKSPANLYAFNSATTRFSNVAKRMEGNEDADKISRMQMTDNRMFENKPEKGYDLRFKYSSSYGGGYRGGLVVQINKDEIDYKDGHGFGSEQMKFPKNKQATSPNLGPGKYYHDVSLDKGTYNIRYI